MSDKASELEYTEPEADSEASAKVEIDGQRRDLPEQEKRFAEASNSNEPRETNAAAKMATGILGTIKEFSLTEDWQMWTERLEQYFVANSISDKKQKVAVLLTLIGSEAYDLLRSLCTPTKPAEKSFEELTEVMKNHLQPKPSEIAERYKFKECGQKEGEDVKVFVAELKKLTTYCNLAENLEEHIIDQFVWGLKSEAIKKRLLGEKTLTYKSALETAISMEAASRDVAAMTSTKPSGSSSLNYVTDGQQQRGGSVSSGGCKVNFADTCYCCGIAGHRANVCRFKAYKCNLCQKPGHLAKVCKSKSENKVKNDLNNSNKNANNSANPKNVNNDPQRKEKHNYLEEFTGSGSDFDSLYHIVDDDECNPITNAEPLIVDLEVEGKKIEFEVDTGSPISAISLDVFKKENLEDIVLRNSERRFKSYTGKIMIPIGTFEANVKFENQSKQLELFVLPGNSPPIMGRAWLPHLNITKLLKLTESNSIKNIDYAQDNELQGILEEFKNVFSPGIGTYTKRKMKIILKDNAKPVFCKSRPVPYALRSETEDELNRLIKEGIIEPVERSDWATPIVPVLKGNEAREVGICGAYNITVNPNIKIDRHPIPRVQDLIVGI